jgi:hypothetical protein
MTARRKFCEGDQPCDNFSPSRDGNEFATWDNEHYCYKDCGKTVSFCTHCSRDHHEGGYQSCIFVREGGE